MRCSATNEIELGEVFVMYIDLHTHTTASDGQYTPSELVTMAKEKNIELLSITDHDTVSGLEEAVEAAHRCNIDFIPGIEISTYMGVEIHILGFYVDYKNKILVEKCEEYERSRSNRAIRICDYLNGIGIPVVLDEVKEYAGDGSIGRPHFAQWLQEHDYVQTRKEAFSRYLDTPRFKEATERTKPTPEEAIKLIHDAGGIAVMAHPGLLKLGRKNQESIIRALKAAGMDGLECFYSKHEKKQEEYYLRLAMEYGLKISCGSDFHGEKVKPDVSLGMKVNENHIEIL